MSRGMPSMVALLGLLAVAGFQNRDKLGGLLGGLGGQTGQTAGDGNAGTGGLGGILGGLGGALGSGGGLGGLLGGGGSGGLGGVLSGGLGGLLDHFEQAGSGATAKSWVTDGPNQQIGETELEKTLGPDTIDALVKQTGLSREELLQRLSKTLPDAINTLTPNGRIPTEDEAGQLVTQQA